MNKPTFNSARLRAAALALCLAQTFLAPVAAVAASEPPIKLMSLRGAEINASDPEATAPATAVTSRRCHAISSSSRR